MNTAILVEKGVEPFALRVDSLDNFINYAPPQNSQSKVMKSYKRVHVAEKVEEREGERVTTQIGIYAYGVKEADAKAAGLKEADLFLNPEKYKDQRTEIERVREENAALRAQLAAKAVS